MLTWIIGIYTLYVLLKIYLSVMQIGYIDIEKQREPVLMPKGRYTVAGNYAIAKERVSIVETLIEYFLFLWWVMYGFAYLQQKIGFDSGVWESLLFIFGFTGINYIVTLPIEVYSKFKIDQSFGFNKSTPKMYMIDKLKELILFVIIGGLVFTALIWIISNIENWWLWGFVLLFFVIVVANLLYPTVIAPMFNKFTPLEEGELKESIEEMMKRAGLNSSGIFIMDASKRDSRLNAYFGGLGRSKRVVLFDTLVEKLNNKELLAVLGHELGHYKHGDIWKNIAMIGTFLFVVFYIFGHLPQSLYIQMGVVPTAGVTLATIMLLLPVASFVFTPVMSMLSRHNEYEADEYGAKEGGKSNLISALLKLVGENKSFPKSDPLYSRFYHSHPPILERLEALGYDPSKIDFNEPLPSDGIFSFIQKDKESEL